MVLDVETHVVVDVDTLVVAAGPTEMCLDQLLARCQAAHSESLPTAKNTVSQIL
jgi:hypothetical protein